MRVLERDRSICTYLNLDALFNEFVLMKVWSEKVPSIICCKKKNSLPQMPILTGSRCVLAGESVSSRKRDSCTINGSMVKDGKKLIPPSGKLLYHVSLQYIPGGKL